jgi:hypothetical protein
MEGAGVITDLLRFPGDPVRRWLDRRVLRDVVREARGVNLRCDRPFLWGRKLSLVCLPAQEDPCDKDVPVPAPRLPGPASGPLG